MVCQVQLNSIKYLEKNGATDDVRRIINEDKFNELNDKLTKLAETKYGLNTNGAKLFSINMSEHIDPYRSTYYRDAKYRILRAEPNKPLFDKLQDLFNNKPDQLYQLNTTEKGTIFEKPIEDLDKYLLEFLKQFGVRSKEFSNLKERLGIDALGATDVLNKIIWLNKNRNVETVPEEAGHMILMLMGGNNPLVKELLDNITNWSEYKSIEKEYMPIYKNLQQVKIEAAGKLLAKALVKNYKESGLNKSLLQKALAIINDFFKKLSGIYKNNILAYLDSTNKLADHIAINVLMGNTDYIAQLKSANPKLSYEKALKNNAFAQSVISRFTNLNAKLTGSLALAGQGEVVYRSSEEPIHDIDFTVDNFEDYENILDEVESINGVPYHYGWDNAQKDYTTYAFLIPKEGFTIEVLERDFNRGNGWVTKYNVRDSKGNIVAKSTQNHVAVDFFVYKRGNDPSRSINIFSKASDIYFGKLTLGPLGNEERMFPRPKDQNDYVLSRPLTGDASRNEFIYYQTNTKGIEEINDLLFMDINLETIQNARSKEIADILAQKLSKAMGIAYQNVTPEQASNILKNTPTKYKGEPAFYYAGTVYTVGDNVSVRTVLHEFSHPLLNSLRKTNNILFQNLYNQALATEEGQGIYYYVQTNYPELDVKSDRFKEEVLAFALQLKALNKINNQIETEGFKSFMDKLLASLKQLLRRIFGAKVNVDKLDVDTTLEEMADMLLEKSFEFKTENVTEDDVAMYLRDVVERARELDKFSKKDINVKAIREIYETNKRIITEAEGFKGDKVSRQFLKETLFQKGTNKYIREVTKHLKGYLDTETEGLSEDELIQNALDAAKESLDEDLQRAIAVVNSLDTINSMTKNMLSDIAKISKSDINNRSTIALLMLYKQNSRAWLKMVQSIDEIFSLEGEMIDSNNPFYETLNEIVQNVSRINTNIANILKNNNVQFYVEITSFMSKYIQDRLKSNLGVALKRTFATGDLEREIDSLYSKVVEQKLTDEDIDALVKKGVPADILKGFIQEYKDLVVDEDKITAALTGGARDITWFNRWLESYSSSNDVIVGPLAMFIQNEKSAVQNEVWKDSMQFRKKLESLLPKVGFSKLNSIAMREKMGFKDKIFWMNKETGKPESKEVWSYHGAFKDYRYHYDLLEYNVEEAKKSEDTNKIAEAIFEFEQFKKDYMWQEFVPEYYEKDEIFKNSEVGKLAYYYRKQKLNAYNNLLNSIQNEYERFEKYSSIQAAWREYQQLYSLKYEDGTPKVDDPANGIYDLSIAKLLQEHREATKDFSEWKPLPGSVQAAYNDFVDVLNTKKIYKGSAEFDAEIEKWRRQNLRMEFDPEYWDSRIRLFNELKELQTKMNEVAKSKFDVAEAMKTINDLIYTYRDEQGEPDSNALGEGRLTQIRDLEQAIADFRFKYDQSTGLSKEEAEELKLLTEKAKKGLVKPGTPESKRYMYLLRLRENEGISPEDAQRIDEIFGELFELTANVPTVYYIETLNYNLSKQNIKEVDEDEVDNYINSEEFQDILDADDSFRKWFDLNHIEVQRYDKEAKAYVTQYKRTKANTVGIPKDTRYIKFTEIIDREGNKVELMGVPSPRHSRYEVKDKYRTVPFGAAKEDYVGVYVDNKNQWLPRLTEPGNKYNPKDNRFINEKYFQMKSANNAEYQLLEAIKEFHLENQKGMSNYSKLYLDMPRYAIKKMDIYQALQKGTYGQRFSELGKSVKEWGKQAFGKSVVDHENELNYDPSNNLVNTDLDGNQISYIPVSGIYNLDEGVTDADIFQGLFKYALSIRTQGRLLESLPLVNSILDTLEDPDNAPKELEKFDKGIYNLKGVLQNAKKKFATNNRLGQVKSLIEREYYGKMVEGIEETHPVFGKWIQNLQGISSFGSLAVNIPSDLKNKYGAYVQLIIEGAGAEFINLKDIALARPWAEKAMLEWTTKGIYQTGPGAISTQLVQIFDPTFKAKDQFGREIERSMVKDLVNLEWLYMHRKFGEMQVAMSLFGAFMFGQKVDQVLSDGTKKSMRYLEAWEKDAEGIIKLKAGVHPGWSNEAVYHTYTKGETLEQIAKKYYIPLEELKAKNRIKSEVQLEDGQELVIAKSELFYGLKNRIQGTSRKLFGAYDEMGQPEGNKLLLYRMFFFMRKWFTPMLMNRFGFDSKTIGWTRGGERYDWATTSYGKGFYVTAFQVMVKGIKSGFRDFNYLTDQEKVAVRKLSAEAFFVIGLALLTLMLFGFDPDDENKWKKIRGRSGAINQDTFNTYGFLTNHMLLLALGVQAESSAFVPLPKIKGVNLGADDYVKMITQTTTSWYNTVVLYIDIFGDVLDFVTFSEMDRYKKDTGPYGWKQEGELKIWAKLGKVFGFTGSTGDVETQLKNMLSGSNKVGGI